MVTVVAVLRPLQVLPFYQDCCYYTSTFAAQLLSQARVWNVYSSSLRTTRYPLHFIMMHDTTTPSHDLKLQTIYHDGWYNKINAWFKLKLFFSRKYSFPPWCDSELWPKTWIFFPMSVWLVLLAVGLHQHPDSLPQHVHLTDLPLLKLHSSFFHYSYLLQTIPPRKNLALLPFIWLPWMDGWSIKRFENQDQEGLV